MFTTRTQSSKSVLLYCFGYIVICEDVMFMLYFSLNVSELYRV